MKILAIETSCDDTGVAIVEASSEGKVAVLANEVASQAVHQNYGGVFPMMAKREHQRNLIPVLTAALQKAGLLNNAPAAHDARELQRILEREPELLAALSSFLERHGKPDVDAIAIVNGPGLEPCLWVGVNFARAMSMLWDIPLIPVNHIEGHILVNWLDAKTVAFPALALVVSGGHTQLILVKEIGDYEIIGETRDDAAGECFDKCAKILGLGYPGGPIISQLAKRHVSGVNDISLPRPMLNTKDYDMSFSGLKTAVLYADKKVEVKDDAYKAAMAHEVQNSIIEVLVRKTAKAAEDFNVKTIILGGGVSANEALREVFKKEFSNLPVLIPPANLSTDNALMSAVSGYFHGNKKLPWRELKADANLRIGR